MTQANILTMLHNDHRKVAKLFKDLEMTTTRDPGRRNDVFNEIDESLSIHADFEERQVYPLLENNKAAKAIMLEALEEHEQLKRLLTELRELDPKDERWMAKAEVLMEDVRHHIEEEEEEAFPHLRTEADSDTLQRLAEDYQLLIEQAEMQNPDTTSSETPASVPRSGSPNTKPQQAKQSRAQAKSKKSKSARKDREAGILRDPDA